MNIGVWEILLMAVGLGFYGLLFWLVWTLVMSVKGIREELSLLRKEWGGGPGRGPH